MPLLIGNTYPLYKKLKAMGGTFDKEAKGWQMPEAVFAEAQALLAAAPPPKPKVPEAIVTARDAVNAAHVVLHALERELRRVLQDTVRGRRPLNGDGDEIDLEDLAFGHHECLTSPTTMCVYDNVEDVRHDDCCYCHQPRDRG